MYNPSEVFRFLAQSQSQNKRSVLITITDVTGASTRNPGAHLVVNEDGDYAGSLSGGCIEAALVSEALSVLADGGPRQVTYGAGSPYIDIRLPCGGSIDLLFNIVDDPDLGQRLVNHLIARQSFGLQLPKGAGAIGASDGGATFECRDEAAKFSVSHIPPLRLAIFGQSASATKLANLALACSADVVLASPDNLFLQQSGLPPTACFALKTPDALMPVPLDLWTAAIFLFHDHDWEHHLLAQALDGPCFFVGAMGSHKTHSERSGTLRSIGVTGAQIAKIAAPIGLIPSMRDPETLSVSVLAQIIERYNKEFLV
jgi:xanthine dehydrogenase accessory factor